MKKNLLLSLIIVLYFCSCLAGRIELARHPDYNFNPTDANNIAVYNGFLPIKEFIIIGQMVVTQTVFNSVEVTENEAYKRAAEIGADAILVSHSQIQWVNYNKAVTEGRADIRDYGYGLYGVNWETTTTFEQYPMPVAKYYYVYILRWKDHINSMYDARSSGFLDIMGKRIKGKVATVSWSLSQIEININSRILVLTGPNASGLTWPFVGMEVDIVYFDRNDVRLYFIRDGIQKELRLRRVK